MNQRYSTNTLYQPKLHRRRRNKKRYTYIYNPHHGVHFRLEDIPKNRKKHPIIASLAIIVGAAGVLVWSTLSPTPNLSHIESPPISRLSEAVNFLQIHNLNHDSKSSYQISASIKPEYLENKEAILTYIAKHIQTKKNADYLEVHHYPVKETAGWGFIQDKIFYNREAKELPREYLSNGWNYQFSNQRLNNQERTILTLWYSNRELFTDPKGLVDQEMMFNFIAHRIQEPVDRVEKTFNKLVETLGVFDELEAQAMIQQRGQAEMQWLLTMEYGLSELYPGSLIDFINEINHSKLNISEGKNFLIEISDGDRFDYQQTLSDFVVYKISDIIAEQGELSDRILITRNRDIHYTDGSHLKNGYYKFVGPIKVKRTFSGPTRHLAFQYLKHPLGES